MFQITPRILLGLAAVLAVTTIASNRGYFTLQQMEREKELVAQKNRELESEIAHLQNSLFALEHSAFAREKKAREELGLSYPNEIVYIFPDISTLDELPDGDSALEYEVHSSK